MGLSCSCPDWDKEPGTWCFFPPDDFTVFQGKRRKRCCSCNELIEIGALHLEFHRERAPYNDIEERILGEEIPMMPLRMCESCGETYLNLSAIGYCLVPTDDMRECLAEYWEETGFVPQAKEAT